MKITAVSTAQHYPHCMRYIRKLERVVVFRLLHDLINHSITSWFVRLTVPRAQSHQRLLTQLSNAQQVNVKTQRTVLFPPFQSHFRAKLSCVIFFHVEFTWGQIIFREENPRGRLLPVFQDPAWRHAGTTGKLTPGGTGWELGPCANILGILKRALFRPTAAVSENSSMLPCLLPPAQKNC